MEEFVPAFAPFQGRARLAHALVNVMCTAKAYLSACGAALFFARSDLTHSYQPDPFPPTEFVSITIVLFALSAPQLLQLHFSISALWSSGIHRPFQRSIRSLPRFNKRLLLNITAAGSGGDDVWLTSRLTPSITQHKELAQWSNGILRHPTGQEAHDPAHTEREAIQCPSWRHWAAPLPKQE